ncbi:hypothetical protein BGZ51_004421 [Haplosporangium sp. Z 767]|nr:hypothetical protein BGZ50_001772 [Haplosporangium sp. Z 11]KAF9192966.1 hypothetical protein BGZ51_004421 [Haplosporangium sp. Z 767]
MDGINIVQLHYTNQSRNGEVTEASVQPFYPTDIVKNEVSGKRMVNFKDAITAEDIVQLIFDSDHKFGTHCLDPKPISDENYQLVVLNDYKTGSTT